MNVRLSRGQRMPVSEGGACGALRIVSYRKATLKLSKLLSISVNSSLMNFDGMVSVWIGQKICAKSNSSVPTTKTND